MVCNYSLVGSAHLFILVDMYLTTYLHRQVYAT
jgi:hypothetical protein